MAKRRIQLIGAHPIAVGNRVEVTWYRVETTSTSLFGAEKKEVEAISAPEVKDLTTGIRYGFYAHFTDRGTYRAGIINLETHEHRPNLHVAEKIAGEVVACSIVDVRFDGRGSDQVETELMIDVD
jgi:hypothetical protein